MKCSQATEWLQLYLDGRLEVRRLARLEHHIHGCPSCARDLAQYERLHAALGAAVARTEPPDLERVIRARVAVYEAARTRAAAQADHGAMRWRERAWQVSAVAAVLALIYILLPASAQNSVDLTFNRGVPGLLQTLNSPGPDSVVWAAWAAGALAVLLLAIYIMRGEASAGLRRSISERLPQLW